MFQSRAGRQMLIHVKFQEEWKQNDYKHRKKETAVILLLFSLISGVTVMGDPAEVYTYGTLYLISCFGIPIFGILNNYLYLPVYYELQVTSVYEVSEIHSLINTQPLHKH